MATETKKAKATKVESNYSIGEIVEIEAVKDSKHLKKGDTHKVSGDVANILINKGLAKAK